DPVFRDHAQPDGPSDRRGMMPKSGYRFSEKHHARRKSQSGMTKSSRLSSSRLFVLLVVVDLGELRVDDVLLGAAAGRPTRGRAAVARALTLLSLGVHGLAKLHGSLRERVGLGADRLSVVALDGFLEVGHRVLDGAPFGLADLGAVLGERAFGGVDERLGLILRL